MKKIVFILLIPVLAFVSCNKENAKPMTKQDISKKVDSISTIRMKEQDEIAQQDLQRRIKIEVKVKVDSIVNVIKMKGDSALNTSAALKIKDTVAGKPVMAK